MSESGLLNENEDIQFISKSHLLVAMNHVKLGFFEMDTQTGEIRCTARCKQNFGICPDASFSYAQLLSQILPEDLEAMQDEVDLALSGEKSSFQAIYRINRTDGEIRWIKADGAVERDGNVIISFVGSTQDITDLRS
ncbi:PAS domain-containing protein [Pedobacter aquatilis]|uniref:PAS domain-containing protein n=1 Tax=Pedobacter aquatilis TaxID=351343 RepID=UPI00292CC1D4|nr:PAS domain-containing protein [Pedobacter aquatilis]